MDISLNISVYLMDVVWHPRVVDLLTFSFWPHYDARQGALFVIGPNANMMALWSPLPLLVSFGPCQHHFTPWVDEKTDILWPSLRYPLHLFQSRLPHLAGSLVWCSVKSGVQPKRLGAAKGWMYGLCNPAAEQALSHVAWGYWPLKY